MEYRKQKTKKKRQRHMESIIQKKDGRCFLCREIRSPLEEHHIFGGPRRKISEAEGLKVYLCIEHHRTGPSAVHRNKEMRELLQAYAQQLWEEQNPERSWMDLMGKNYRGGNE